MKEAKILLGDHKSNYVNVGLGLFTFIDNSQVLQQVLGPESEAVPKAIWLFGDNIIDSMKQVRKYRSGLYVIGQVSSIKQASELKDAGIDAVVIQGTDAGGHGAAVSASIISLIPEARDKLGEDFTIIAAGGVGDGRAVAAALCLGSDLVCMGTAFAIAEESLMKPGGKERICMTTDGGKNTVRYEIIKIKKKKKKKKKNIYIYIYIYILTCHHSLTIFRTRVYDDLRGTAKYWTNDFNGRGLKNKSFQEYLDSVPMQEMQTAFKQGSEKEDVDYLVVFAGTSSGLCKRIEPAKDIVSRITQQAVSVLKNQQVE